MMSRTSDFLNTLSDHELAFFVTYKLHVYMPETQAIIKKHTESRNLDAKTIAQLTSKSTTEFYKSSKCCPRCGTNKLLINNVEWTETYGRAGYADEAAAGDGLMGKATYKDEIICNVCDYWLKDPNNKAPRTRKEKPSLIQRFIDSILDFL